MTRLRFRARARRAISLSVAAAIAMAPLSATRRVHAHGLERDDIGRPTKASPDDAARLNAAYARLPLSFEANGGQMDPRVKFSTRGNAARVFLTDDGATFLLRAPGSDVRAAAATMTLAGANADVLVTGEDGLPGRTNYFIGSDPAKWRTGIPTYAKVRYHDVYDGIDLVYYGNQQQLEYDFVVAPGADPNRIEWAFEGVDDLRIDERGDLVLTTAAGEIRQHKPILHQEIDGERVDVAGAFVLTVPTNPESRIPNPGGARVSFSVSSYDASLPLVIDPVIAYSTYLGGSNDDAGYDVAVDSSGAAYVTGSTLSSDFPTTGGALDTSYDAIYDVFVTKLAPDGASLVYSTYLGTVGYDEGLAIAVDASGAAYITGYTIFGGDFPTTPGAYDTTYNGFYDVFVTKLATNGASLVYSTHLGSSGDDVPGDIAVDASGAAYVTGSTFIGFFPTTGGAFDTTINGGLEAFVTKFAPDGATLAYSTLLGGSTHDIGRGVAVDSSGAAYVTGFTNSTDFPTAGSAFDTTANGAYDVFVTKVDATGASLAYSTYLGGTADDSGLGIALDAAGAVYLTGDTASTDFPTTAGALDTSANGSYDAFVTKLVTSSASLTFSTYLGGTGEDHGRDIAVDTAGTVYVAGATHSTNFPTTAGAFDTTANGDVDVFVTRIPTSGSSVAYSTYLGGSAADDGYAVAVDATGKGLVTGTTRSTNFPTVNALDPTANGTIDAFVTKLTFEPLPVITSVTASPASIFPADRRMSRITVSVTTTPPGATCAITGVSANTAQAGAAADWSLIAPLVVDLRAERPIGGVGRVYTVTVACDGVTGTVQVPVSGVR